MNNSSYIRSTTGGGKPRTLQEHNTPHRPPHTATQQFALIEAHAFVTDLHALGIYPQRVILFGSFARNEQHEWSAIDLAIVAEELGDFRPENSRRMSPALSKPPTAARGGGVALPKPA